MTDALTAGEQGVHELLRLELVAIARTTDLEPLHRVPCGILDTQGLDAARFLKCGEHLGNVLRLIPKTLKLPHQLHRIFERELRARPDGKVRRVHRIAQQHDMTAVGIAQPPLLAHDALEIQPGRTPLMPRVAEQWRAVERF